MTATQLTYPSAEPLSLTELKAHLRLDTDSEDTLLSALLSTARLLVEADSNRALVCQQWSYSCSAFPKSFVLPKGPFIQMVDIRYLDNNGALQTLATTEYLVDTLADPVRIMPAYNKVWPVARRQANSVQVRYYAGYATPCTFNVGSDQLAALGRPLVEDETLYFANSGGALPSPLVAGKAYTAKLVSGSSGFVYDGLSAVDVLSNGTGLHFIGLLPATLLAAIKLMVSHLYENREATTPGNLPVTTLPMGYQSLVWSQKDVRIV